MYEDVTLVKIGKKEYPLLYNAAAYREIRNRYSKGASLNDLFVGPEIYPTDSAKVKAKKQEERDKATSFFEDELPALVAILAKQGVALMAETEKDVVPAPTAAYVDLHMGLLQVPSVMGAVISALTRGMQTEHSQGENEEIDVVLQELESKNAEGATI